MNWIVRTYGRLMPYRSHHEVAVVIPIYKPSLTEYERISLDRCLKVLQSYPLAVVAPEGLTLEGIDFQGADVSVQRFSPEYFAGISGYNRLMLSREFYHRFLNYRYVLIHQLDAFVFTDTLSEWCALGYDYIGAPWIGTDYADECRKSLPMWSRSRRLRRILARDSFMVGNGGLSLRKVRSCLLMLKLLKSKVEKWPYYEDIFWGILVPSYNRFFKIPGVDIARRFAIELRPRESYEENGECLPFGCHAWEKYDPAFWRGVIGQFGYHI